jgi:hypothetical protein
MSSLRRNMRFTIDVIMAAAVAKRDLTLSSRPSARSRFEFTLLAAAVHDLPVLPPGGWEDAGRQIKVTVEPSGAELRIELQAQGFTALSRVSGMHARLASPDGTLDVRLRFDRRGYAFAALEATDAIRRALVRFDLILNDRQAEP